MKAYVVAAETVHDQEMFDAYRKEVMATLAPFGGTFVVRGGKLTVVEGEWPHPRLVIIEFPDMQALLSWYQSPDYQRLKKIRERCARTRIIALEGLAI